VGDKGQLVLAWDAIPKGDPLTDDPTIFALPILREAAELGRQSFW